MNKRTLLLAACLCLAAFGLVGAASSPNVVLIFTDDLGYGDLGCYGHPGIRSPNLDRMAQEGIRFTDFYSAAPVCTPSRAALLTGRYPIRNGMCDNKIPVLFPYSSGGLPQNEVTIAELLKEKGYATACIGKWHLGHLPQFNPTRHGFDLYYGLPYSNDMQPKEVPLLKGEEVVERPADQATLTRRYTEEAVQFIKDNRKKPFFLYLPHTFPHTPLFVSDEFKGKSHRGLYGDVVEELDWSVGQILKTLKDLKIDKNTLVFFTSDNGPWLIQKQNGGSAGLLRNGKNTTWEGGMRVPAIARWPGKIKPGQVSRELASTLDLYATIAELAKAPVPKDRTLDSTSLAPVLFNGKGGDRELFFYYKGRDLFAARKGNWKIHFFTQEGYGGNPPVAHDPPLLFRLDHDPSEQYDVAKDNPMIIADLRAEVEKHKASIEPVENQLEKVYNPRNP